MSEQLRPRNDLDHVLVDQKTDNELMFTRGLLCGLIEQAVEDAKNDTVYESKSLNEHREMNQRSAIAFLNSTFYSQLCNALGNAAGLTIPAKRIRQKAMS
jgi:hypothetical protein